MTTGQKALLLVLSGLGVGIGSYFLFRKSNAELKREILNKVSDNENDRFAATLDQMNRQELLDTLQLIQYVERSPKSITDRIDPLLQVRLEAISKKYNIFT